MSRVGKTPEPATRRSPRLLKVITTPIKPQTITKKEASPALAKKEKAKKAADARMKTPDRSPKEEKEKKTLATTRSGRKPASKAAAPLPAPEPVQPVAESRPKRKTPEKPVPSEPAPTALLKSPTVSRVMSEEQQQKVYSSPELHTMSRLEIQRIARTLNIPTNQKTEVLVQIISDQKKKGVFHGMNVAMRQHHGREPESPRPKELNMKTFMVSPSLASKDTRVRKSGLKVPQSPRYSYGRNIFESPPSSPTKLRTSLSPKKSPNHSPRSTRSSPK